jgi:biopolymer transport protein ExbD
MAEINTKTDTSKRSNKNSTKVDLTAMVDLGFLLITFFILATTMAKPKSMLVNKPEEFIDPTHRPSYPKSKTMTLLLGSNDKVYYYTSPDKIDDVNDLIVDSVDFSPKGLRRAIEHRQKEVVAKYGEDKKGDLFVMIKPLPNSTLKNTIDTFDELNIMGVSRFALINPAEAVDSIVTKLVGQKWGI